MLAPALTWRLSRTTTLLLVLMLVGLALRLWFVAVNVIDPRFSAADDGDYFRRALRFAATGQYLDDSWLIRPPLHVFMFAAIMRLGILVGAPDLGIPLIRGVQIALSLLMIPLGYDLVRRLFNPRAGLVFATIMALWFPMVELPALILSEPLFVYMLMLHLWLLVLWRDRRATRRSWLLLGCAGMLLGLAALARSPALYSIPFVLIFVGMTLLDDARPPTTGLQRLLSGLWAGLRSNWLRIARLSLVFVAGFVMVVGPWTLRNYLTYQRFIVIDTLGPVNLWLTLTPGKNDGAGEGEGKSILASIPQAERQEFVSSEIRRIVGENPLILTRNFWPHFQHIWKAQFVEDFLVKASFFTRPLYEVWPIGALGDLIWFTFAFCSLFALAAPLREGAFRWLALGWMAYSMLIVMIVHVEPRYLLPLWLMMAIYGAAAIGTAPQLLATLRSRPLHGGLALLLAGAFLVLVFSYRDYPAIIARGFAREEHRAAGAQAYAAGDYATAASEFEQAIAAHPFFVDARTHLALSLLALDQPAAALDALADRTHRADLVRGAILRALGRDAEAAEYMTDAEFRAGEDVQVLALDWLRPPPRSYLDLGDGLDFGYLAGFSPGETKIDPATGATATYRWMRDQGTIVLPLVAPLQAGSVVKLRLAGAFPASTPLTVTFNDGHSETLLVSGGQWRLYRLAVPAELAGASELRLTFAAPTFIPVQLNPGVNDVRSISVMFSAVWVD